MRMAKTLAVSVYLVSWAVCFLPVTPPAKHEVWDGTQVETTEEELEKKNNDLAIIENDSEDYSCGCELTKPTAAPIPSDVNFDEFAPIDMMIDDGIDDGDINGKPIKPDSYNPDDYDSGDYGDY